MYGHLKVDVAEAVCALLEPVQQRYQELRADPAELERVMKRGSERARERASETVARTYDALGLVPRPR
ncbi:MAG: tryptophan--tRNA ligase, partial [Planctomycetota bacterium]|nr:tryptophan--tRNA ligase [Planctomycetota bacterium]